MKLKHAWLILGAYGIWFAVLSGIEEIFNGTYWKFLFSLILGVLSYIFIEIFLKER